MCRTGTYGYAQPAIVCTCVKYITSRRAGSVSLGTSTAVIQELNVSTVRILLLRIESKN